MQKMKLSSTDYDSADRLFPPISSSITANFACFVNEIMSILNVKILYNSILLLIHQEPFFRIQLLVIQLDPVCSSDERHR